jgi:serine protease AprX
LFLYSDVFAGIKLDYNAKAFKRESFLDKVRVNALKDAKMPVIIETKNPKAFADKLKAKGIKVLHVYDLIKAVAVQMPAIEILKLSKDSDTELIHEDLEVHTCLDKSVPLIGAPKVWKINAKGKDVVVAVVDTGVDKDHPDLKGKVVAFQDFTEEGAFDGNGHGTHVAGTIAGTGSASGSKYVGVAPEAKIIAAKVLTSQGSGSFSGVIAGIEWATKQKPQAMNLSLGANVPGSCDGTDPCSMAVDAAVDAGVIVCIAAGNAGPGSSTVGYPGCDNIAWFSSRGPTLDKRVKPDILLPGVNIIAARAKNTSMGTPINDHYTQASGTSMATPHCAGVAALLKSAFPDLTPQQAKEVLMSTAIDLKLDPNTQGKGRVDVEKAFVKLSSGKEPGQKPPAKTPETRKPAKKPAKKPTKKKSKDEAE